jgi:Ca2+-binding EF-hand superfamily protein
MPYFNVYEAFNSLDQDGSGHITRDEFKRLIQSRGFYVSEKEATEIVNKMDKDRDGHVSFAEVSPIIQFVYVAENKQYDDIT